MNRVCLTLCLCVFLFPSHVSANLGPIQSVSAQDTPETMKKIAPTNTGTVQGGGCERSAYLTVTGGGVSVGEVFTPSVKGCSAYVCYPDVFAQLRCAPKVAAQGVGGIGGSFANGLAYGFGVGLGSSLVSRLSGSSSGGGGTISSGLSYYTPLSGEQANYAIAPVCSDIVSDSGTTPVGSGDPVTITWVSSGGTAELTTLTPLVGVVTDTTIRFAAPVHSTTYTVTLSNRVGASSCSIRVFVGPRTSGSRTEQLTAYELERVRLLEDTAQPPVTLVNPLGTQVRPVYSDTESAPHMYENDGVTTNLESQTKSTTQTSSQSTIPRVTSAVVSIESVPEAPFYQTSAAGSYESDNAREYSTMRNQHEQGAGNETRTSVPVEDTRDVHVTGSLLVDEPADTQHSVSRPALLARIWAYIRSYIIR